MRRVVSWLTAAVVALASGVWAIRTATRVVVLPEVNNVRAERGKGPRSFRCDSPSSETAAELTLRGVESEFYQTIIRGAPYTNKGNRLVVERLTIQVSAHRRFEKWDRAASGLLTDGIAQCVVLSTEQFPEGVNFIDTSEVQGYSKPRAAARDVPDQVFAFSRARFDSAGRNAVVYYERLCHGCGVGEYVWFRRDGSGASWQIAGRDWGWIN